MTCNDCNNPCNKGCKPAKYARGFYDEKCEWQETDTTLSTDYSTATLTYSGERHTDQVTGGQLGSLINLPDLRDVDIDYDFNAMCAEFIYHKFGECGDGCMSQEDAWNLFSIDREGALQNQIRYVRGANAYGCPVFLDVPTNTNQYWYAGWRPNGQFGYYQAANVPELPKDAAGNYIVMGQDPNTKQPIVGSIPNNIQCLLDNIMGNLGMGITSRFSKTQEYVYITGWIDNPLTGHFTIKWQDWYYNKTQHVGDGYVTGRVIWDKPHFDQATGNMIYTISGVWYDKITYVSDKGAPSTAAPLYVTLKSINLATGAQGALLSQRQINPNNSYTIANLNTTVSANKTITVAPGQTYGPLDFIYIFVDWESSFDDEGTMGIYFQNKITAWESC